nr:MAG TPA: hypothetical protein [Caudoviricetes sp.]
MKSHSGEIDSLEWLFLLFYFLILNKLIIYVEIVC